MAGAVIGQQQEC